VVCGGGSAGVTERLYAETAKKISDGMITSAKDLAREFIGRVPSDRDFEASFATQTVRRGWLARYYLIALEKAANDETQPELVPNADREQLNLEHVLPRKAEPADWPHFGDDELSDMKLMLGNQVLLRAADNTSLGNGPFKSKREVLANSKLKLTREVGDSEDWTPEDIRCRQARLAVLAVKTWRRSIE
jgi:Protein of unknown function (DUF1524)